MIAWHEVCLKTLLGIFEDLFACVNAPGAAVPDGASACEAAVDAAVAGGAEEEGPVHEAAGASHRGDGSRWPFPLKVVGTRTFFSGKGMSNERIHSKLSIRTSC